MSGQILWTDLQGGRIQAEDGTRPFFQWADCDDSVRPNTVGAMTPVKFYQEIRNNREIAVAVKRA